jgi:hypothetical protein
MTVWETHKIAKSGGKVRFSEKYLGQDHLGLPPSMLGCIVQCFVAWD